MSASLVVPGRFPVNLGGSLDPGESRYQQALDSGMPDVEEEENDIRDFDRVDARSRNKLASAVGTAGKVATGAAILGGAAIVGSGMAVAGTANKMKENAVGNFENGLLEALLDGMSYSPLEEKIARHSAGLGDKKKSKDEGMSL